jgi:hypothetical protein
VHELGISGLVTLLGVFGKSGRGIGESIVPPKGHSLWIVEGLDEGKKEGENMPLIVGEDCRGIDELCQGTECGNLGSVDVGNGLRGGLLRARHYRIYISWEPSG